MNRILTPTGYKNENLFKVGDEVIAYDTDTGEQIVNTITKIDYSFFNQTDFYLVNDRWRLFAEQSIWANNNVKHVKQLQVGDIVYNDADEPFAITSVVKTDFNGWIRYEINDDAARDHSYILDGLTLHNASRFWVGGSGTLDNSTTTHWSGTTGGTSGASVPGTADNATFDGNSGGGTVIPNYNMQWVSITWGAFTGTIDFLTNNNSPTITNQFSGSGAGARTINMGNGTWTFSGSGVTVFTLSNVTGLTYNTNGSTLNFTYSGGTGTRTIIFGGSTLTHNNVNISAGSDTVSLTQNIVCSGNFSTSGFTGTFSKGGQSITVGGNFTLGTGSIWSSTSNNITLNASGSVNITTNGVNVNQSIVLNGTGTFNLTTNLDMTGSVAATITLTQGTITDNSHNVFTYLFNYNNANVKTINLGTGNTWTLNGTGTVWNGSATNTTLNCGTCTILLNDGSSATKTFASGASTFYTLDIGGVGTGAFIIGTGTSTLTLSNLITTDARTIQVFAGKTIVITNSLAIHTDNPRAPNILQSTVSGTQYFIKMPAGMIVSLDYLNLQDSNVSGAMFYAGLNSTDSGNNIGWVFNVPGCSNGNFLMFM